VNNSCALLLYYVLYCYHHLIFDFFHLHKIRGYDFAIGHEAVIYLFGCDTDVANQIIASFDRSGTKV